MSEQKAVKEDVPRIELPRRSTATRPQVIGRPEAGSASDSDEEPSSTMALLAGEVLFLYVYSSSCQRLKALSGSTKSSMLHLTNRRIVMKEVWRMFSLPYYSVEQSFRLGDLQHVSVQRTIPIESIILSASFLIPFVAIIATLQGAAALLAAIPTGITGILYFLRALGSFGQSDLVLNFYKEETVSDWLHSFSEAWFREGSSTRMILNLSTDDCFAVMRALLDHTRTVYVTDKR